MSEPVTVAPDSRSRSFDRCFTLDQAAAVLGTSRETVRRLVRAHLIAHQNVSPRRTVIRESALRDYLEAVTVERCP